MLFYFVMAGGFAHNFGSPYKLIFLQNDCYHLDLGYFNHEQLSYPNDIAWVGIGHSLGLQKLLSLNISFKALIGIQAFTSFLGRDQQVYTQRKLELHLLKKNFMKNPEQTLYNFYKRCGNFPALNNPNKEKLLADLSCLEMNTLLPKNIPTLILASQQDPIVPIKLIDDNFKHESHAKIVMHPSKNHSLITHHSSFVYEQIINFL